MKFRPHHSALIAHFTAPLLAALWCIVPLSAQDQASPGMTRSDSIRKAKELFINGTTLQIQGGRDAEAILEFQQSLRYDSSSTCLAAIARCYARLGKLELAYEYVELSLDRNRQSRDAWELLAEIEVQRGRYDEGLLAFEEILKLKPTRRQIMTLARLYEPRNARRAITLYEELNESDADLQILARLADLYERLNDDAGLLRTLSQAVELEPANPQFAAQLSERYVSQGMFDELLTLLARWQMRDPDMQGAGRVWAVALSAMLEDTLVSGMYPEKVASVLDAAFETHASSWPLMAIGAALAGRISDTTRSVRMMNMAITSQLAVAETYLEVARLAIIQQMSERALRYARLGRDRFTGDMRMLLMEASIYVERGNDSMAIETYREVTRSAPLLIDAWAQLGWLHDRHGRTDSSDVYYERALQIDPRNPFVCNNYAYSLVLRRKDLQRALQLSATSLDSEPNNAAYLDTYAWILYHLSRYDEAEKAARHAIEVGGNATHHEHYGMIQEARGDIAAALAAWQRSLELDPGRTHLKAKIDRYK